MAKFIPGDMLPPAGKGKGAPPAKGKKGVNPFAGKSAPNGPVKGKPPAGKSDNDADDKSPKKLDPKTLGSMKKSLSF